MHPSMRLPCYCSSLHSLFTSCQDHFIIWAETTVGFGSCWTDWVDLFRFICSGLCSLADIINSCKVVSHTSNDLMFPTRAAVRSFHWNLLMSIINKKKIYFLSRLYNVNVFQWCILKCWFHSNLLQWKIRAAANKFTHDQSPDVQSALMMISEGLNI